MDAMCLHPRPKPLSELRLCLQCMAGAGWRVVAVDCIHLTPDRKPLPELQVCLQCMAGAGWRVVVVDESHNLRTVDRAAGASTTEAAVAAVAAARRAVLLSGTPSLSRPFDLFRQVRAGPWQGVQGIG